MPAGRWVCRSARATPRSSTTYSRLTWTDGVAPPPLVSVSGVIDSPYRGLSAFEERDAAFFFGREAAATQVLERMSRRLDGPGLLVVSGVSGAGKSSLLRAGVLPRMRGAGLASAPGSASWPCLVFTPARRRWMSWRYGWRRWRGRTRPRCGEGWPPIRPGSPSPRGRPPWRSQAGRRETRKARRSGQPAAAAGGRPVRAAVHPVPR